MWCWKELQNKRLLLGPSCGAIQCMFNEECCMTCNNQGQLVPANRCAHIADHNHPGCPQPFCVAPGTWHFMTIKLSGTFNSIFFLYQKFSYFKRHSTKAYFLDNGATEPPNRFGLQIHHHDREVPLGAKVLLTCLISSKNDDWTFIDKWTMHKIFSYYSISLGYLYKT